MVVFAENLSGSFKKLLAFLKKLKNEKTKFWILHFKTAGFGFFKHINSSKISIHQPFRQKKLQNSLPCFQKNQSYLAAIIVAAVSNYGNLATVLLVRRL